MARSISNKERASMRNPILQFFKYIYLSLKIMKIVAGGHGSARNDH